MNSQPESVAPPEAWCHLSFGLLALAAALLLHLYWGILHDAVLYTMQGLAHWRPELYANDIFLKYGSQDRYTLFGTIQGWLIALLGVDHAAALMTAISQVALFAAAGLLARTLMPSRLAVLALALLAVLDLPYGAGGVFHVVEDFLSPRMLSEALALGALACIVNARTVWACALLAAAASLHPIMALAVLVCWPVLQWPAVQHKARLAIALVALVAVLAPVALWMQPTLIFNQDWLSLVLDRAPYLAMSNWSVLDWTRLTPPLATLSLLTLVSEDAPIRRLSIAALGCVAAGLLLTWAGGDCLHVVLVLQAQPWRWTWLAVVLGTLLIPPLIQRLWDLNTTGRAALALWVASYALQDELSCPVAAALAIVVGWLSVRPNGLRHPEYRRLVAGGAIALLALALAWDLANRLIYARIPYVQFAGLPTITLIRRVTRSSCVPALLLVTWWWWAFGQPTRLRLQVMGVIAAIALLTVVPFAVFEWKRIAYPPSIFEAFAPWRSQIPSGSEVLWVDNPLKVWIYLERPSYYSEQQLSTALFSLPAAKLMQQRVAELTPLLIAEGTRRITSGTQGSELTLAAVCQRSAVRFIATRHDLSAQPLAMLPTNLEGSLDGLKLYRCEQPLEGADKSRR